jgi:hypothetical protein
MARTVLTTTATTERPLPSAESANIGFNPAIRAVMR